MYSFHLATQLSGEKHASETHKSKGSTFIPVCLKRCSKRSHTLHGLEDVLQQSVRRINTTLKLPKKRPVWQDDVLQDLLQRRRAAHDRFERANLSKLIPKHLRQNMRRRRNARASQILAEFQDLGRLDSAHIAPIFFGVPQVPRH